MKSLRFHFLPLAAWTLLWLIFFCPLILGLARLPNGDFAGQFHAFALFQFDQLQQGIFPLWSGGSFGGFPFAADTQAAVFYPLRWVSLLIAFGIGEFSYHLLTLEGLFHIWLAGVFTYGLSFSLTRQRLAALVSGMAFGLGGYLTSYPLLQLAILETIAWLPLVLWLLRRAVLGEKRPLPSLVGAAVVLGIAFLAGHPQTFLHCCYLAAAYYLFLTFKARWTWRWRLGLGALFATVTLGTAMIAGLPAWHYLSLTTRSEVGYEFVSQGFPLLNYMHLLIPRTLSLWAPEYVGLLGLMFALFALWGRIRSENQAEILFWGFVALIAGWLSLGDKGILFELIYRLAPGFTFFRQQERLVNFVSLSMALLAGQGVALWCQLQWRERRRFLRPILTLSLGGMLLFSLILALAQPIVNPDWLTSVGRQWLVFGVALLVIWFGRKRPYFIVLILAVDLFIPIRTAMNLQNEPPDPFWAEPDWVPVVQNDRGRFDSRLLFHANAGEIYGIDDIRGISPLKLDVVERFETLPRSLRWQLLGVTHVVAEEEIEAGLTAVLPIRENIMPNDPFAGATLYRFDGALPRSWISYEPIVASTQEEAFARLTEPMFSPETAVILTSPRLDAPPPLTTSEFNQNRFTRFINRRDYVVQAEQDGWFVLSEWAVPGWQVAVNGQNMEPTTANYGFIAVPVAAGDNDVTLYYVPLGLVSGGVITAVTLVLALLLAWRWHPSVAVHRVQNSVYSGKWQMVGGKGRVASGLWPLPNSQYTNTPKYQSIITNYQLPLILLLGFILRITNLGTQELRGDEAFSYLNARIPFGEIVPGLLAQGDPHSPLHYLMLHGWMRLAGDSEFAMRFISLVPGVLLIALVYQLGRMIGGRRLGVLTALLLAISQSHVWVSQDVRNQYTLSLFFISAATVLLLNLMAQRESGWRRIGGWGAYAVLCSLAVYAHFYGAFALLGHAIFMLLNAKNREKLLSWDISVGISVVLFLPWVVLLAQNLLQAGQLSDPSSPELAQYLTEVGIELFAGSAVQGGWLRWIFLLGLGLCGLGVRTLWQQKRDVAGLLLGWLVATVLIIFLIRFSRATFNTFYISIAAPALLLLLAVGLLSVWQWAGQWGRRTAVIITLLFVTTSGLSLVNYYTDPQYSRSIGYREMAQHVSDQVAPNDLFLAHFPDPSLVYYLRDVPLAYEMQPAYYQPPAVETTSDLAQFADQYERIWFVPAPGSAWDAENVVPRWLDEKTIVEQTAVYTNLTLSAHRAPSQVQPIGLSIGQKLDDVFVLEHVHLTIDGVPVDLSQSVTVPAGGELVVTLLWRGNTAVETHYTVFVQLLDENGVLIVQDDSVPARGLRPTMTWKPEEWIVDPHTLPIPTDRTIGRGQLIVGMYETATVDRLIFETGVDALPVARFE